MEIKKLQSEVKTELLENILPFWMKAVDLQYGGFVGQITGTGETRFHADKGVVLNARILWTFSAAYRVLKDPMLLAYATRAKDYLLTYFLDKKNGGLYWAVDYLGNPTITKKQIYALGFAIYGLSEYHRVTGDKESLDVTIQLFNDIEKHSFDTVNNGYFEAFSADWAPLDDVRLSDKDANESKTMNTHLHILEPYTNLYRVWKSPLLKQQIENLIELFLSKFLNTSTYHLNVFFNDQWENRHHIISYGHDIEASWLIHEAALEIGNPLILQRVEAIVPKIADACKEGLTPNGSLAYECHADTGSLDTEAHWWVQAEAVIGYLNAYQLTGNIDFRDIAFNCWEFIKDQIIDKQQGEWVWSVKPGGIINHVDDKLGPWKCPYHNSRMCLEILERNFNTSQS